MWNKMMEENVGVERQKSKKGFEKNEHACSVEGVFVVSVQLSDPSARPYLKLAGPNWKMHSSSKLRRSSDRPESEKQKSLNTPLGLTGIARENTMATVIASAAATTTSGGGDNH